MKGCENPENDGSENNSIKTNRKMKRNTLNTINIIQLEEKNNN